jgi:hypothetical protein
LQSRRKDKFTSIIDDFLDQNLPNGGPLKGALELLKTLDDKLTNVDEVG